MAGYRRFVSYVYEYHQQQKGSNRGFMKVEYRDGLFTVNLSLKGLCHDKDGQTDLYVFRRGQKNKKETSTLSVMEGSLLQSLPVKNGLLNCRLQYRDGSIGEGKFSFDTLAGVILLWKEDTLYASQWDDEPMEFDSFRKYPSESEHAEESARDGDSPEEKASSDSLADSSSLTDGFSTSHPLNSNPSSGDSLDGSSLDTNAQADNSPGSNPHSGGSANNSSLTGVFPSKASPDRKNPAGDFTGRISHISASSVDTSQTDTSLTATSQDNLFTDNTAEKTDSIQQTNDDTLPVSSDTPQQESDSLQAASTCCSNPNPQNRVPQTSRKAQQPFPQNRVPQTPSKAQQPFPQNRVLQTPSKAQQPSSNNSLPPSKTQQPSSNSSHPSPASPEKVPPVFAFKDGSVINCRQISIRQLQKLHPADWHLRNNRFIHYGYHTFGHLLIGELAENHQTILGVPGNYHQQECLMANLFGFSSFVRCPGKKAMPQGFGYWYRPIHPIS